LPTGPGRNDLGKEEAYGDKGSQSSFGCRRSSRAGGICDYPRPSTDHQVLDAKKLGDVDYGATRELRIDNWVTEKIIGAAVGAQRELGKLVPKLRHGDALVVPELSRLGRSTVDVLATIKALRDLGVAVHVVKGGVVLGNRTRVARSTRQ
jgi:DNA invertase Pin-like site-specific DNA recombinase